MPDHLIAELIHVHGRPALRVEIVGRPEPVSAVLPIATLSDLLAQLHRLEREARKRGWLP